QFLPDQALDLCEGGLMLGQRAFTVYCQAERVAVGAKQGLIILLAGAITREAGVQRRLALWDQSLFEDRQLLFGRLDNCDLFSQLALHLLQTRFLFSLSLSEFCPRLGLRGSHPRSIGKLDRKCAHVIVAKIVSRVLPHVLHSEVGPLLS